MILFVFFVAHHYRSWFWFACGVIGLGSIIADWLHGNVTQLTVTSRELTVRGNVAKTFDDSILFSAQGLSSLTYYDGGEDDPSGLYAFSGISRTCLISGLNEQQSMEIALLIYKRFPDLESGDTNSGSLLFGDRGELTSLGLSKPN